MDAFPGPGGTRDARVEKLDFKSDEKIAGNVRLGRSFSVADTLTKSNLLASQGTRLHAQDTRCVACPV